MSSVNSSDLRRVRVRHTLVVLVLARVKTLSLSAETIWGLNKHKRNKAIIFRLRGDKSNEM